MVKIWWITKGKLANQKIASQPEGYQNKAYHCEQNDPKEVHLDESIHEELKVWILTHHNVREEVAALLPWVDCQAQCPSLYRIKLDLQT